MSPFRVLLLTLLFGCAWPASLHGASIDPWSSISLAADRARLLTAAHLDPELSRASTLIEIVRRLHEADLMGEDLRARTIDVLGPITATPADDARGSASASLVPLPLTPAVWDRCIPGAGAGQPIVRRIISDSRAGFLYLGLASLDDRTRVFIADDCDALLHTARERPATFAAIARSFRVADGRAVVPGGRAAVPAWEALVGRPVTDPAAFFKRLLLVDDGRLGWCFDTLFQLDSARQAYALGAAPGQSVSAASLDLLYREFRIMDPSWSIEARPFARVPVDAGRVLAQVEVADAALVGRLRGSWLDAIFEGTEMDARPSTPITAPELLRRLLVDKWDERQDRLVTVLYVQRMASRHPEMSATQLVAIGDTVRRLPALAFCLEHMGVTSVDTITAVAGRAAAITEREQARPAALTAFQGAIALLDRLVFVGSLEPARATRLLDALVRQPEHVSTAAHVGAWLRNEVAPAVSTVIASGALATDEDGDVIDDLMLHALAGRHEPGAPDFEWEGERYRLAFAAAEYDRLRAIRERQAGPSLGDAYRLLAAASDLAHTPTAQVTAHARTLLARLIQATDEPEASVNREHDALQAAAATLARSLGRPVREAGDARKLANDLAHVGEAVLARVLRSYAYACRLGDPDSRAFLAGDLAARHDLGLSSPAAENRRREPWLVPEEDVAHGRPWHVRGSMLGLELPLGRFALRRLLGTMPDDQPVLTTNERQALLATLAFLHPRVLSNRDRTVLLDAVRRGRDLVVTLAADDSALGALRRRAGVSGWRAHVLRWAADHEPEALLTTLTRAELFWIGVDDGVAPVDAWGGSTWAADRAWRVAFPPRGSRELYAGRPAAALSIATLADVTLHLAETTDALGLPAGVVACIMPAALQDYFDAVRPGYQDDWLAFSRQVDLLSPARVEDYVAGLTVASGPLRPLDSEGSHSR